MTKKTTEGYRVQEYHGPVKRFCQTLDLKDNPALIAEYRKRHSEGEAWSKVDCIQQLATASSVAGPR